MTKRSVLMTWHRTRPSPQLRPQGQSGQQARETTARFLKTTSKSSNLRVIAFKLSVHCMLGVTSVWPMTSRVTLMDRTCTIMPFVNWKSLSSVECSSQLVSVAISFDRIVGKSCKHAEH